jgi:hypothetical protein
LFLNEKAREDSRLSIVESSTFFQMTSGYSELGKLSVEHLVPFAHLKDFQTLQEFQSSKDHVETSNKMCKVLKEHCATADVILTHDFVFTGWFLPYGIGCKLASIGDGAIKAKFLHWVHSIPSGMRDYWTIRDYGPKHTLVYPNETDRLRIAEQFRGFLDNVRVIPHIKDIRTWMEFDDEAIEFINDYPEILSSDIVQVYPASTDRLIAKRISETMDIFRGFKSIGHSVFLCIANQHATGRQRAEDVSKYKQYAATKGLTDREFVFTSDFKQPLYQTGIPKRMVRELMSLSNVFIFPTREESFGLVVPEVSLCGGALLVLNRSLPMQSEISKGNALFFDFGSYCIMGPMMDDKRAVNIAAVISGRLEQNESVMARTHFRKHLNMDYLYKHKYLPIMLEGDPCNV